MWSVGKQKTCGNLFHQVVNRSKLDPYSNSLSNSVENFGYATEVDADRSDKTKN